MEEREWKEKRKYSRIVRSLSPGREMRQAHGEEKRYVDEMKTKVLVGKKNGYEVVEM